MGIVNTHRDLLAWQEAMTLVELVYRDTSRFPREEAFGLTAQRRRAALSVPSNIAEGAARNSSREFVQFLGITCGSIAEVETQLELAVRLGFLHGTPDVLRQANRVGCLVRLLRLSLKKS
jgi:four helix bundle protein